MDLEEIKTWYVVKIGNLYVTGKSSYNTPRVTLNFDKAFRFCEGTLFPRVKPKDLADRIAKRFGGEIITGKSVSGDVDEQD